MSDHNELVKTNEEIGKRESQGDKDYFNELLAPSFAFMRASGDFDGREDFLKRLKKSDARTTLVASVSFTGVRRAIVTCIVEMSGKHYHNIRTFVQPKGKWLLLSWANEEVEIPIADLRPPKPSPQDPVPI